ncbi:MAG: hypothetical protein D6713_10560 [Deltaproteobacteria bacterium]|nr:MAG: hypothetical protein D6713_10560 [Deltaproteobacteria bacterium]
MRRIIRYSVFLLFFFLSCAATREMVVDVAWAPGKAPAKVGKGVRVTVQDFRDLREDRERIGVDYTSAADIKLSAPLSVAVTDIVTSAMKEAGIFPIIVKETGKVSDYKDEYPADFHLQGDVEELFVSVKRKGLLAAISCRGRLFFSLYDREGNLLWNGRFSSETTVSSPFSSEKGVEEALSDTLSDIVRAFLSDPAVGQVLRGEESVTR